MSRPNTNAEWAERDYQQKLAAVVQRLRNLADEVEARGAKTYTYFEVPAGQDKRLDYVWAAHEAVHAAMWGLANADLSGLVAAAGDAQRLSDAPDASGGGAP